MDKLYVQQYGLLEKSHWWFVVRQKIILQILQNDHPRNTIPPLKILNVGAAAGGSSKWLSVLGDVTSIENDPLFLSYLSDQHIAVIDASITDIPLEDNNFDLVCAFDVIEHVSNDSKAVAELIRVCKPGGSICITVPAFPSLWGNHDVVNGHKRRYRQKELQQLLSNRSVTILYSSYFNSLLFIPIFLFRKMQTIFNKPRHQAESDFRYFKSNALVNKVMKFLFGAEVFLLRYVRFPFGVSLVTLIRKNDISANGTQ